MKLALWIMCVGLTVLGCKKGEQSVENQGDAKPQATASKAPAPASVQTATGDMKDLLLALRRVHFAFDEDTLSEAAKQALSEAAEKLSKLPDVALYVDGHTDDRGTTEYNMSLGERRAQTVVSYLERLGVEQERLNVVSFGEETPMASGTSDLAHAKNRRVEFRIMRGDVQFVLEEGDLVDDTGKPLQASN